MRLAIASIGAAAVLVAIGVAGIAASSGAPPVASLRTLPVPPKLPSGLADSLRPMAPHAGLAGSAAVARTRLLLSDVTGLPLYAFGGTGSRVCFLIWHGGGTCGEVSAAHKALWIVNGGSRKRGQAVVGVVADGVRAVDVRLGSRVLRATV